MKKIIAYGVAVATLATGTMFLATPAFATAAGTASSMSVAQGGTFTATVTNENPVPTPDDDWCMLSSGSGFSLVAMLTPTTGSRIYVPDGGDAIGTPGLGSFTWGAENGESISVEVTIPADTPTGTYSLFYGCVSESPGYLHTGLGAMVEGDFVVTAAPAAPLPDTGSDNGAVAWTIGAVSATLLAVGAGLFFVRRRLS